MIDYIFNQCKRKLDYFHELLATKAYKKIILGESKFKVSIEAGSTDCWKKYIGDEGLAFGINEFGKSAPYKEIYKHFGLTSQNISKKIKNTIKS